MVKNFGCGDEQALDVLARLGRSLETEHYSLLPLELLHLVDRHFSSLLHVLLVAHEEHDYIGFTLGHDLVVPIIQVGERLLPGDVVGQEDAVGTTVEYFGDTLELFLAGCVPNLELEHLLLELDEEGAEFDSDGDLMIGHEFIIGKSVQEAGLAHCGVAYYDQFEEEVLVLHAFVFEDLVGHPLEVVHELVVLGHLVGVIVVEGRLNVTTHVRRTHLINFY